MKHKTHQSEKWCGEFGKEYAARNKPSIKYVESIYLSNYGLTRRSMNELFLSEVNKDIKILEVGCNVGNQLVLLKQMGFTNLYGIEISDNALEIAKGREEASGIHFGAGNALDIPFENEFFDMVFTSGVLIHISPRDIKKAVCEVYRCSSRYIWGFEYFAEDYQEIIYRGHKDLLWKADFVRIYAENFKDLMLVKEKRYQYLKDTKLEGKMFFLKKQDEGVSCK